MIVSDLSELGERVRERRLAIGLSQGDLAELTGSTRQWVSRLEQGREGASVKRLLTVFDVLGLDLVVEAPGGEVAADPDRAAARSARARRDGSRRRRSSDPIVYSNELVAKAEAAIAERVSYRAEETENLGTADPRVVRRGFAA